MLVYTHIYEYIYTHTYVYIHTDIQIDPKNNDSGEPRKSPRRRSTRSHGPGHAGVQGFRGWEFRALLHKTDCSEVLGDAPNQRSKLFTSAEGA